MTPDFYSPLVIVADSLERLGVRYYVGGSVASTTYGTRRSTADIDLVAELRPEHVTPLLAMLGDRFYGDADAAYEAIRLGRSFNLIHFGSAVKVDVFVMQSDPFSRSEMERAQPRTLEGSDPTRVFPIASAEDIVLRKLLWYRATGEQSERQWGDIVGVLKYQSSRLDRVYLDHWAAQLGVTRLLSDAQSEADLEP